MVYKPASWWPIEKLTVLHQSKEEKQRNYPILRNKILLETFLQICTPRPRSLTQASALRDKKQIALK
ncbi:hypothetical protein TWF225_001402 [Orbilia oligospora]|nr:hypothetical protein TWF225_001402 [Orbilia oligospora]